MGVEDAAKGSTPFDPTGSHPLPNASLDPPAASPRGCGCDIGGLPGHGELASILAVFAVLAMKRRKRSLPSMSRARFWW